MMGFEDEMYEWEEEQREGKPMYRDSYVYIKLLILNVNTFEHFISFIFHQQL